VSDIVQVLHVRNYRCASILAISNLLYLESFQIFLGHLIIIKRFFNQRFIVSPQPFNTGGFMHNNITPTIPQIRPVLRNPTMPSDDFPLMLEDLTDAEDISSYVEHMFSHREPMLSREEEEVCDMATD
jgi:hypothetical protein